MWLKIERNSKTVSNWCVDTFIFYTCLMLCIKVKSPTIQQGHGRRISLFGPSLFFVFVLNLGNSGIKEMS